MSPEAVRAARLRLFIQPQLSYAAPALLVSFFGAVAIGATVFALSSVGGAPALIWIAMVAAANGATMWFNVWASRRTLSDADLERLVYVKSGCQVLQGLAWGAGVPILNVPGELATIVAPAWAMVTGVGLLMFASAPWPPSSYAFITALFSPAVVYLLRHAERLEFTIGVALIVCFPFCLIISRLAARYVSDLVAARLAVNRLLERESRLSAKLLQLNDERTRFFSSASHDLRQPLQALNFYTTLIGLSPGKDEQRDLLARLAECSDTLDRQFNAILGVASADATIERAEPRPAPLDPLIRRAMAGHLAEAELKGLKLRAVATQAVAVVAPEAAERILSNLIGNAVRYTQRGGVVVGVRHRDGGLALTVADSGIGISEEDQSRIFDDFFQVANPERDSAKGFGLGLAIVKRLTDGLGWPISLRSRPGRGSVFSFIVPKADSMAYVHEPLAIVDEPAIPVSAAPVMVLDDDGLVRDALARLLRSWQVEHRACARPDELMTVLRETPGRRWKIVLDYRLEDGVKGTDVVDEVRRQHGDLHQFILLSGEADPALDTAAQHRGVILLRKPLKPIRLRAALSDGASRHQDAAAG